MTWRPAQPDDALLADELVRIGMARNKRAVAVFVLYSSGLFTFADIGELLGVGVERARQVHHDGQRLMWQAGSEPREPCDPSGSPGHAGQWVHKPVCGCARCNEFREALSKRLRHRRYLDYALNSETEFWTRMADAVAPS